MIIGIDTSIIVACVHVNHPMHAPAAGWLEKTFSSSDVVVAHHSVLEVYAVLARMPGDLRVEPLEARDILSTTICENSSICGFSGNEIWDVIDFFVSIPAVGGQSYDAFIIGILKKEGIRAFATFNRSHFERLNGGIEMIDPSRPY